MKDILKCKHPNSRKTKALAKKTKKYVDTLLYMPIA